MFWLAFHILPGYATSMEPYEKLRARMKVAATELASNEDQTTVGVGNVYENPHRSHSPSEAKNSEGVWEEYLESRPHMIGRLFDSAKDARQTDQSTIDALFGTKDYESHSPLLQREKLAHTTEDQTLKELVRGTLKG